MIASSTGSGGTTSDCGIDVGKMVDAYVKSVTHLLSAFVTCPSIEVVTHS